MAIHSLNSLEIPLLASAFSSVLPHVICGQPTGRECATQLFNNCRGARLMGIPRREHGGVGVGLYEAPAVGHNAMGALSPVVRAH